MADLKSIDKRLLFSGRFGIERETLRVTDDLRLAQTPHPFGDDEQLSRDFCENQLEIITPVADSPRRAIELLAELHGCACTKLSEQNEYLWPFSNPPYFGSEDDIPIAQFDGHLKEKQIYRQYLARKYGKKKMLFSGIHLNFSFTAELLDELKALTGLSGDEIYLRLSDGLVRYSFLITLLTAASSAAEPSFLPDADKYASPRCSEVGYWNDFTPVLDHSSLYAYCSSIQGYVNSGRLVSASELYYPVRLKPRGENTLEALLSGGIDHIELRMYDLDPLAPYGIFEDDIHFAQLLMLYILYENAAPANAEAGEHYIEKMKRAALYDADEAIKREAEEVLDDMLKLFSSLGADSERVGIIEKQKRKLAEGQSYAETVRKMYGYRFTQRGGELARRFTLTNN